MRFRVAIVFFLCSISVFAQESRSNQRIRVVTIPITVLSKQEIREKELEEVIEAGEIIVKENGQEQQIISIRGANESPLSLAILIQDDLSSAVNLELKTIREFIRRLPSGSRVMVAYIRGGNVLVRQKFTDDLEKASKALSLVSSSQIPTANNIFQSLREVIKRFDSLPSGRRAILLVSDGIDSSLITSFSLQSLDLDKAIKAAQQRGVAVYAFYAASNLSERLGSKQILNAQSVLIKLSEETGGKSLFTGLSMPVSFSPFLRELALFLDRQLVLTYLSTNMKKGYYRVEIKATNPEIKIEHPKGYYYK
ncbi:MAG: hypothetical protein N2Z23_10105 [Pyrinomonadaceae bacterium]|nr:hypothetical protein [Pyrinomonadaceae bacterium]MCX7640777.1 hypothetical protein [Pyrinomonadaceae bacterium]MDW8304672.1 hypothetical protein [Acidobacteriota bacterium]